MAHDHADIHAHADPKATADAEKMWGSFTRWVRYSCVAIALVVAFVMMLLSY